jgi:hypothetical protein
MARHRENEGNRREEQLLAAIHKWRPEQLGEVLRLVRLGLNLDCANEALAKVVRAAEAQVEWAGGLEGDEAERRLREQEWERRNEATEALRSRAKELTGGPLGIKVWRSEHTNEVRVYFALPRRKNGGWLAYTGSANYEPGCLYEAEALLEKAVAHGLSEDDAVEALIALGSDAARLPFPVYLDAD